MFRLRIRVRERRPQVFRFYSFPSAILIPYTSCLLDFSKAQHMHGNGVSNESIHINSIQLPVPIRSHLHLSKKPRSLPQPAGTEQIHQVVTNNNHQ